MTRHPGEQIKSQVWEQVRLQARALTGALMRDRVWIRAHNRSWHMVRYRVRNLVLDQLEEEQQHDQTSR